MAVDPEAFDVPVVDYDFSKATSPRALIEQMAQAGGFTATKFAEARQILSDMKAEIDAVDADASKVTNWLSFPACLCATGTRGFFVEAMKRRMYNVVSTTCGTLDHDIARAYKHYYHGSFDLDDVELGEHELMRLGNVIVPNASYGEIIEAVVLPVLEDIYNDRLARLEKQVLMLGLVSAPFTWYGNSVNALAPGHAHLLGCEAPYSRVHSGITDGSIGAQLFMFRQKHRDFHLDTLADEQIMSDLTWDVETSNALWWVEVFPNITSFGGTNTVGSRQRSLHHHGPTRRKPFWARLREAISWGKMRPKRPTFV